MGNRALTGQFIWIDSQKGKFKVQSLKFKVGKDLLGKRNEEKRNKEKRIRKRE
jgi:hypothetical protein